MSDRYGYHGEELEVKLALRTQIGIGETAGFLPCRLCKRQEPVHELNAKHAIDAPLYN